MTEFRSGFVTIMGRPNVGKSTLLNNLVGQKVAIVSSKPQTTRNNILGVLTTKEYQIVFADTPGIHRPVTKLGEYMVKSAHESAQDADMILFLAEAGRAPSFGEEKMLKNIEQSGIPVMLVINKIDQIKKEELLPQIAQYSAIMDFEEIIPISAKRGQGCEICLEQILKRLPQGPMYYPEEMVSEMTQREIAAEMIREKLLRYLDKEVPHGIAVDIDKFEEKDNVNNIVATIFCEKATHKGIIIGKDGEMLKRIGTSARADIERMCDKKVFLELWVKVKDDWRNNDYLMKSFGFQ